MVKLTVNQILVIFSFLCFYILSAQVFDCMKIPFSLFTDTETSNLNNVLCSLAGSYLMGVFIYTLTVILKNKIERRKRIWEIYDLFKKLEENTIYLDDKVGSDFAKNSSMEWFEQVYNQELNEYLIKNISSTLEKVNLYRYMLSDTEINLLHTIQTNLCIDAFSSINTDNENKSNFKRLKQIYNSITLLNNGIIKEIKKGNGHEM